MCYYINRLYRIVDIVDKKVKIISEDNEATFVYGNDKAPAAVADLEKLQYPTPTRIAADNKMKVKSTVFTHTGKGK